jgi:hypothetical protein
VYLFKRYLGASRLSGSPPLMPVRKQHILDNLVAVSTSDSNGVERNVLLSLKSFAERATAHLSGLHVLHCRLIYQGIFK